MADLMQIRRRILLNTPRLETASGDVVTFRTSVCAPVQGLKITFYPKRAGSGTPSPSNVRQMSAWKKIEVYSAPEYGDASKRTDVREWSSSRSSGYIDFAKGTLTHTSLVRTFNGNSGWSAVGNKFYCPIKNISQDLAENFQKTTTYAVQYCNMYPFDKISGDGSAGVKVNKTFYLQRVVSTLDWNRVWVYDTDYTLDEFKALLNATPLQVSIPIQPETYALTGDAVKTLAGQNVFWTDSNGPMEIEYWKV